MANEEPYYPPSGIPTQGSRHTRGFVLDFSPDGTSVVFAKLEDDMVTVLNLKSGVPWLTIHTSIGVYGLKMTKDAIVVIGDKKMITWNLPVGNCAPGTLMDIKDNVQTVNLTQRAQAQRSATIAAPISPDLHRAAISGHL